MTLNELKAICYPESKKIENEYTFFTLIFRRISIYFSFFLIKLKVPANLITIIGIFLYILGCYYLTKGNHVFIRWGAVIINLSMFLDLVDGEIARFNGPTKLGGFLDLQHGNVINSLLLPCSAFGIYNGAEQKSISILLLAFAGTISLFLFITYYEIVSRYFKYNSKYLHKKSKSKLYEIVEAQFTTNKKPNWSIGYFFYMVRMNLFTTSGFLLPFLTIAVFIQKLRIFIYFYSIGYMLLYIATVILTIIVLSLKQIEFN